MNTGRIIFIAGPTAGGKSAAALCVAQSVDGEIVNADAMQVYEDLHILTARPSLADEALVPHHLYGMMDGVVRCSAGRWGTLAASVIADIQKRGRTAIVTGGTGLYFRALEEGLSPIPDIALEIRQAAAARREEIGAAAFHDEVVGKDPAMARLPVGDAQRLLRAWEVVTATGKTLSYFQSLPRQPLIFQTPQRIVIEPERSVLYARCDNRAHVMLEAGALEEVRRLLARSLDEGLPVMKALGVGELSAFLRGEVDRDTALAQLQQNTRRFAKRQLTWFRNQASQWQRAEAPQGVVKMCSL